MWVRDGGLRGGLPSTIFTEIKWEFKKTWGSDPRVFLNSHLMTVKCVDDRSFKKKGVHVNAKQLPSRILPPCRELIQHIICTFFRFVAYL